MNIAIVTGSAGLIGSESVEFLLEKGFFVVGIDNDMRKYFFGKDASTYWRQKELVEKHKNYIHYESDIRNKENIGFIFSKYGQDVKLIVHTAAQPSHDWAAKDPLLDFDINATGTLIMLEATRKYCPEAVFIFTSTNKVYGDKPNTIPLIEMDTRYEVEVTSQYRNGIGEDMTIDHSKHSVFGASKVAADIMVQEYGKYFGMKTVCFRCGCLTGPQHSGTQLHGFLNYLMKCAITGQEYTIFGYKGKQVRDNIHAYDLVNMFWHFYQKPGKGEVYNAGGGRHSNCSMLEAIKLCEEITGKKMNRKYDKNNRIGDHMWWISDVSVFKHDYPEWDYKYDLEDIFVQIYEKLR